MNEQNPSITALVTAFARAYHAADDSPKIFEDYLAGQILSDEELAFLEQSVAATLAFFNPELASSHPDRATALNWVMKVQNAPIAISRARYVEDCLESAIQQGSEQYVILGAGLETFAFRRPEVMDRLEVFEVDLPATQRFKQQRLEGLGWAIPSRLHFVSVDLTVGGLAKALDAASYDRARKSFFSWPGVTYYLEREAILETLRIMVGIARKGSAVVFDYIDSDALVPEKASIRMQRMQAVVQRVGEPMRTAFDPAELREELDRIGLRLKEDLTPADIEKRYFAQRTDGYHAFEHVHFAWAEVAASRS